MSNIHAIWVLVKVFVAGLTSGKRDVCVDRAVLVASRSQPHDLGGPAMNKRMDQGQVCIAGKAAENDSADAGF